jgi:hypothetical protein
VIATAAGADVAFLVTEFNAVFCLGKKSPALGISAQRDVFEKPQLIRGLQGKRIIRVACSAYKKPHVLALSAEGSLYSFGSNRRGQLGVGDKVKRTTPVRVHLPQDASIIHMSCGDEHSVALGKKGKLYGWGSNHFGEISLSGRDVLDPEIIDTHQEIVLSSSAVKYATTYITSKFIDFISFASCESHSPTIFAPPESGLWYRGSFRMKSDQNVRTHPLSPKVFPPVSGSDPFYRVVGQLAITASGWWRMSFDLLISFFSFLILPHSLPSLGQVFAFGWDNVGELGMSQPGDCIISPKRPYDLREEQVLYISTSGHQSYFITGRFSFSNLFLLLFLTPYSAKGDVWMCGFVPSETPEGATSQGQTPASSFSSYSSLSANPPGFGLTSSVYNSHFSRDSTLVASIADLHK